MDIEIQAQIRKVQTLSKFLGAGCAFIFVVFVVISPIALSSVLASDGPMQISSFRVPDGKVTLAMRLYGFLLAGFFFPIALGGLYHLQSLFANLSVGDIYTAENVRNIRRLGWMASLIALWFLVGPMIDAALIKAGVFSEELVIPGSMTLHVLRGHFGFPWPINLIGPFILAGLVVLTSWIMEVGRRTSEEVDHMRREAELVV